MDRKEVEKKMRQAIWQTMSEAGPELSFSQIKRGIDARIPEVHTWFLSSGFKEKEWNLEIQEILSQLRGEEKITRVGVDNWHLLGDFGGELGGFDGD